MNEYVLLSNDRLRKVLKPKFVWKHKRLIKDKQLPQKKHQIMTNITQLSMPSIKDDLFADEAL